MAEIQGKVWRLGDNIDTDIIIPSQYCVLDSIKEAASHTFQPIFPNFAREISKGDIIVAGKNFGCGSSREQAPRVLKEVGVGAIVAKSFARIFFRNAINIGLAVIDCASLYDTVKQNDELKIIMNEGKIENLTTKSTCAFAQFPPFISRIFQKGGLAKFVISEREKFNEY